MSNWRQPHGDGVYKSEHGQDQWLNQNVFNNQSGGFFVEAGAWDGITSSNTYFFEKELGWDGLLIEPDRQNYLEIAKHRDCRASNALLWESAGELDYISFGYGERLQWSPRHQVSC